VGVQVLLLRPGIPETETTGTATLPFVIRSLCVAPRNLPTYNRVSFGVRVVGSASQLCSLPRVCSVRSAVKAA
jgi:hypothetical protein